MGKGFAAAFCFGLAVPLAAEAQVTETAHIYRAAGSIATNIRGVTTFAAMPRDFDALHASDAERAAYGLPPQPDPQAAPDAYRRWARAMALGARKTTEPLTAMHAVAGPPKRVGLQAAIAGQPANAATENWSGIVNALPNVHGWNPTSSFSYIVSEFNVPIAQEAFSGKGGTMCNGVDTEVSWAGIDGWETRDVLQGGSLSQASCISGANPYVDYCAWAEWYPSTPILCQFNVNAGDDLYVEVWDTSATNGYVYLLDETQGIYTTLQLTAIVPPFLAGNSAEYVVERPGLSLSDPYAFYPLANYVTNFWGGAFAYRFGAQANKLPTQQFPGSHNSDTVIVNMVDDAGTETISSATAAGPYGIVFQDSGCAFMGGCAP